MSVPDLLPQKARAAKQLLSRTPRSRAASTASPPPRPVLLANGTEVAISKIHVGDKVVATDPETGKTEARLVTNVIVHGGKHTMVDVDLADESKLTATDHHPFWDATTGRFGYAIDLRVGDQVREADGTLLAITAVHAYDQDVTAYNLTVDGIHTYYAGSTPVLVHNSCISESEGLRRQLASEAQMAGEGEAFAGRGTSVPFRGAADAAARYGGEAADYAKVSSVENYNGGSGIYDLFETHWIEDAEGTRFEFKTKFPRAEAYFASLAP